MVEGLSQEILDVSPPEGWSIGQLLDHLRRADGTYGEKLCDLIELRRSGRRPAVTVGLTDMEFAVPLVPTPLLAVAEVPVAVFNYFLPETLRAFFLRNPIIPARAPAALTPESGRSKEELIEALRESMNRIELLFLENLDLDFASLRYYHPLFGYKNAYGILRLMTGHEQRHQKQLRALIEGISTIGSDRS